MIRKVLLYPDPVLKQKSALVEKFDASLLTLATDLRETMVAYHGAGLSAVQVGDLRRLIVVGRSFKVMVNPHIDEVRGAKVDQVEGCLSFPGVFERVPRHTWVRVSYQTPTGECRGEILQGLDAHVVQHEIEHIDGMLISDRMNRQRKWEVKMEMRKLHR